MASDFNGKSDPYVKLCLTGRYLSHGQEWSERLRLKDRTRIIKTTLNPVWDEEFCLPVRRAGAVLKVEVWDWDRSSPDDPLGHFEVAIGEELLSQQEKQEQQQQQQQQQQHEGQHRQRADASKGNGGGEEATAVDGGGDMDTVDDADDDYDNNEDGGEINSPPESPIGLGLDDGSGGGNGGGYSLSGGRQGSSIKLGFGRKGGSMGPSDHSHQSEQEARACDVCIERRRKRFGEVRLILWYQYDEFAEMCSHTWPEEPLKPPKIVFSPNQLYRKGMVFWEMFKPYVTFLKEVDAINSWGRPRRSLMWMLAVVGMLVVPPVLIVVVNVALMHIAVSAYLKRRSGGGGGIIFCQDDGTDNASTAAAAAAAATTAEAPASTDPTSNDPSPSSLVTAPAVTDERSGGQEEGLSSLLGTPWLGDNAGTGGGSRRQSLFFLPAFASSPVSPARVGGGGQEGGGGGGCDGGGGEETTEPSMSMRSTSRSQRKSSTTLFSLSRTLTRGRRVSDPDPVTANTVGSSTAGVALRNSSSAPSRTAPWRAKAPRSAPPSTMTMPTTMARTSIFAASSGAPQSPFTPRDLSISNAAGSSSNNVNTGPGVGAGVSRDVVHAAGVAKGGMISAAGAGSKKIKKLLPVWGTRDPELRELYERLGSTKRVPAVVNQLGKVFFTKSGPSMQLGLDKMGVMLIKIRQRFHPLHARDLGVTMTALFAHMVLQLWLYVSGRFNLYFVLLVVSQSLSNLYKRWGKAFVLGLKEARRSCRTRQALSHAMSATAANAGGGGSSVFATTSSSPTGRRHPPSPSAAAAAAMVVRNTFMFDAANPPAFAPPGTTPALEPYHNGDGPQQQSTSLFFAASPLRGRGARRRRGSVASSGSSSMATTSSGGVGGSYHDFRGGGGAESDTATPRRRGGTVPSLPVLVSPPRARSFAVFRGGSSSSSSGSGSARPGASDGSGRRQPSPESDVGDGGAGIEGQRRGGAGGGKPRRWRMLWGKRTKTGGGGGGGGGGLAARGQEEADREQGGDLRSPSPVPPRGGNSHGVRARGKIRMRWGRVIGATVALVCGLAALSAVPGTFFSPPQESVEEPVPSLAAIWQAVAVMLSGMRAFLSFGGNGGLGEAAWRVAGAKMTTVWGSGRERLWREGASAAAGYDDDEGDANNHDEAASSTLPLSAVLK
ncbi:unnamed protein product [Ectocarpus sp. CCAP 1310/34]|nr:unnamed protein product [Ectocarpus sp. CCAP 1310/34]